MHHNTRKSCGRPAPSSSSHTRTVALCSSSSIMARSEQQGLQVLSALDAAKTQWYHFTAIVVAGMGFFTDAYDLFCISLVTKLLGDKMGRKSVYGMTLILMVICSIGSGLSFAHTPKSVMATLCFFRFWLGFGIGGDYPLSATIMSEYANKKTRG
uniref:Major facilitator superfamily (MFS) profile domain-containing protein n=1 Tax=Aegilops tauschii subsp. strangulata TaxID=200361 RepID=A0A453MD39_AEGTS